MAAPPLAPDRIVRARFVASSPSARLLPAPVGTEIAFAGRSNVGKSSLLNGLTGQRALARTSSTPGCTREVVLFEVDTADGARLGFADLPGYGFARRSKHEREAWAGLVEEYLLARPTLRAVAVLVDPRRGLEPDDADLLTLLESPARVSRRPLEIVLVATKLDKLGRAERKPALARLATASGRRVVGFSVEDRDAVTELWRALRRAAGVPHGTVPMASDPESSRAQSP